MAVPPAAEARLRSPSEIFIVTELPTSVTSFDIRFTSSPTTSRFSVTGTDTH